MLTARFITRQTPIFTQSLRFARKRKPLSTETVILHKDVIEKEKLKREIAAREEERAFMATQPDMPCQCMDNPYKKPAEKCIVCKYNIPLDWKNTRFLSQFTSPYTGRIYDRGITGLCLFMQRRITKLIIRSRFFGYMHYEMKEPKFIRDPKLFDPFKRK